VVPRLESRRKKKLRQVLQPEGDSLLHFGARCKSLATEILIKGYPKKIGTARRVVHKLLTSHKSGWQQQLAFSRFATDANVK